jgi:hypothetical protein
VRLCARRPRVRSTPRLGTFGLLPPSVQVCGDQPCVGNGGGCGMDKGWLQNFLFCSKDCRMCYEMVKFERSIGIGNRL